MNELLDEIGQRVARECEQAYFVGGCVRDLLRGEPIKDVDFVVQGSPRVVGRALREAYDGHVFALRE